LTLPFPPLPSLAMDKNLFTTTFHNYHHTKFGEGNTYIQKAVASLSRDELFSATAATTVEDMVTIKPPLFPSAPTVEIEAVQDDKHHTIHEVIRVTFTLKVAGEAALLRAKPKDWKDNNGAPCGSLEGESLRLTFDFTPSEFTKEAALGRYREARRLLDAVEKAHVDYYEQLRQGSKVLIDQFLTARREQVSKIEKVKREIDAALGEG